VKRDKRRKVTSDPENQDSDLEDNPQKHVTKGINCEDKSSERENWLHRMKQQGTQKQGQDLKRYQDHYDTDHEEGSLSEKVKQPRKGKHTYPSSEEEENAIVHNMEHNWHTKPARGYPSDDEDSLSAHTMDQNRQKHPWHDFMSEGEDNQKCLP